MGYKTKKIHGINLVILSYIRRCRLRLLFDIQLIPFFGSIPIIGNLFSNSEEKIVRTETVVLITPHIIKDINDKFLLGEAQKMKKTEMMIQGKKVWSKGLIGK